MNRLGECKSCRNAAIVAALECRNALLKSLRPYTVFTLVSFLLRLSIFDHTTFGATPHLFAIHNLRSRSWLSPQRPPTECTLPLPL
jgi:hypothetical protein